MKSIDLIRQLAQSKTFFGVAVLVVGAIFKNQDPTLLTQDLYNLVLVCADAFGASLVVWGRMTAKGPMITAAASDNEKPKTDTEPAPYG